MGFWLNKIEQHIVKSRAEWDSRGISHSHIVRLARSSIPFLVIFSHKIPQRNIWDLHIKSGYQSDLCYPLFGLNAQANQRERKRVLRFTKKNIKCFNWREILCFAVSEFSNSKLKCQWSLRGATIAFRGPENSAVYHVSVLLVWGDTW